MCGKGVSGRALCVCVCACVCVRTLACITSCQGRFVENMLVFYEVGWHIEKWTFWSLVVLASGISSFSLIAWVSVRWVPEQKISDAVSHS